METDEIRELESILIGIMRELGVSRIDAMINLALIKAHQIQEDMILWVATFKDEEHMLTAEAFRSHIFQLTD